MLSTSQLEEHAYSLKRIIESTLRSDPWCEGSKCNSLIMYIAY
jgi:hypothetical protein